MDKRENEIPQRLMNYMEKINTSNLKKVDMGSFMLWLSDNLNKFKEENKIYYYNRLTDKQSEEFTEFLKNAKL